MMQFYSKEREALYKEFYEITGWHFNDAISFGFDVVKLDDLLQSNPQYKHTKSCKHNLTKIFGKRSTDIVETLLKLKQKNENQ